MKHRQTRALQRQKALRALNRSIFAAFFLSGLAGLMHEVVWAKLLVPLMGATAYAQAVVLGVWGDWRWAPWCLAGARTAAGNRCGLTGLWGQDPISS